MINLKLFTIALILSVIPGCAIFPQTYDSPIPVYVDLGDAKPMTTTLIKSTPNHNTQPNY